MDFILNLLNLSFIDLAEHRRELVHMPDVIRPDAAEDAEHLLLLALGDGVAVHGLVHEGVEHVVGLLHLVGKADRAVAGMRDEVREHGVDAHGVALAHALAHDRGHVLRREDAGAQGVVEVVIHVGDVIGDAHEVGFNRVMRLSGRVIQNADARLVAEV